MNAARSHRAPARALMFAMAAGLLTVIVLGEIGLASVRAVQHAVLLRA